MGIVFYAFRVMVGIGMLMLGLGFWSLWLRYRRALYDTVWMHRAALLMGPSGFVAVLAGWVVTEVGRAYAGGWWDWLSPFSLLTGLALVVGYALLGATWLMLKTEGQVAQQASRAARVLGLALLGLIVVVSIWTPFLHEHFMRKWFAWPEMALVLPVPFLVAVCALLFFKGLSRQPSRCGRQPHLTKV